MYNVLEQCIEKLNEECIDRIKGQPYHSPEFHSILQSASQMKAEKILTLPEFVEKTGCSLPRRTLVKMLEKIHTQVSYFCSAKK